MFRFGNEAPAVTQAGVVATAKLNGVQKENELLKAHRDVMDSAEESQRHIEALVLTEKTLKNKKKKGKKAKPLPEGRRA
ncbi:hypothetical protein N7540_005628 [Penicillium herquei]|nr:hypothetical protein N7540_005628 [Penicillium herquei]